MAALPDVLVLRQGANLYGLDPYSLQQLWVYHGKELVAGPILVGERLFVIQKEIRESHSREGTRRTTYHHILEIAPASGLLQRQQEAASSTVRLLSGCGRAVFLLDGFIFTVAGEGLLSRVFPARRLKRDLAQAFAPERIRLAGSHLLAWVPELRLEVSLDLERNARAWQRGFPEEIVDVGGCGSVQVATTAGGALLGLDARTGKTVWQSKHPKGPPTIVLLQSGQPLSLGAGILPALVNLKDGTIRTLSEEGLESPGTLLEDGHGRVLLHRGSRLGVHGIPSGNQEWSYDAGQPIRLLSAAESYVALVTETGRLDVLGQSRAGTMEARLEDSGGIDLTIDPEDAHVWLDGSYLGTGGRSLVGLRPGTHRLRLVHPDRRRLDTQAEVAPGRNTPLFLPLERRSEGPLRINSMPSVADVFLDGEKLGQTPFTAYSYPAGQVVKVTVSKTGYRDVSRTLGLREEGAELAVDLKYAPPLLGVFGIVGYSGTGAIRGWQEADIREGRVEGDPYRPADGSAFAEAVVSVELGPQRWRLFARGGFSTHEDIFAEGEGGLWFAVNRRLRVEVGASYLALGLNHSTSEPPTRQQEGQRGSTEDRNAPLEEWTHPIPRVFVENKPPSYLVGKLRLRPRAGLFIEFGAGLLEGARLRGTALIQDAAGHLVKDSARSYDFEGRNGGILDARLQLALGTFRVWKLYPKTALDVHFQQRWADFGPARESAGELTMGIGVLSFNNRPGAAP